MGAAMVAAMVDLWTGGCAPVWTTRAGYLTGFRFHDTINKEPDGEPVPVPSITQQVIPVDLYLESTYKTLVQGTGT